VGRLIRKPVAPLLAMIVVLTIAWSGAASAHANYAKSDPAPNSRLAASPPTISVDFSEAFVPAKSGLEVLAADGRRAASGGAPATDPARMTLALSKPLANGTYAVAWHTVSAADGDPAHGYFAFSIGPPPGLTPQRIERTGTQATFALTFAVDPGVAGENLFQARITSGGSDVPNVTRVRMLVQPLDLDLGISSHDLAAQGSAYADRGMELAIAGRYRIMVQIRRRDILDDLVFPLELEVPASGVAASASPSASPSPSAAPETSPPQTSRVPTVSPSAQPTDGRGSPSTDLGPPVAALAAVLAVAALAFARTRGRR
jgi:methionine-rich copper-binding protein CopC